MRRLLRVAEAVGEIRNDTAASMDAYNASREALATMIGQVSLTATAVSTAVVAVPMLDLNHSTIRRCHRGNAQPGGSGHGHRQRSKQRRNNKNEASHPFFLPIAEAR